MSSLSRHKQIVSNLFQDASAISDNDQRDDEIINLSAKLTGSKILTKPANNQGLHWENYQKSNLYLASQMKWRETASATELFGTDLEDKAKIAFPSLFEEVRKHHSKYKTAYNATFAQNHIATKMKDAIVNSFITRTKARHEAKIAIDMKI